MNHFSKFIIILFLFLLIIKAYLIINYSKVHFTDVSKCHGKRDGISGCRKCCSKNYTYNYNICLQECMQF